MYPEIVNHILVHKYFINEKSTEAISFEEAAISWFNNVFLPIISQVKEDQLLTSFPGKTYGDLYLWIVRHWDNLKHGYEYEIPVSIEEATKDFKARFSKGTLKRWIAWIKHLLSRK